MSINERKSDGELEAYAFLNWSKEELEILTTFAVLYNWMITRLPQLTPFSVVFNMDIEKVVRIFVSLNV